ncbi:MAG: diacylglycerol kinase family lipid kinase [Verrucomicrobia bacterium]|nr:diacylglycerol kinase family lipid kinase [Verrucomicrobiota bacterium]
MAGISPEAPHRPGVVIGIIFNPTARGDKARQFRAHLAELGPDVRVLPTAGPGHARTLAATLAAEGFATITAAGGDGTVNEVLNGLAETPGGLERCRLAVIPLGTVNVFAKETGIPTGFHRAWSVIQAGRERLIDLPQAEFSDADGNLETRYFILMAGAGLGARAIERVDWELKKRFGPLAYVWAGCQAMRPPHPKVTVEFDGTRHRAPLIEVGAGRFFGGRFVLFPGAHLEDGQLGVTLLTKLTWLSLIRLGCRVVLRQLRTNSETVVRRTQLVKLSCPTPMPLHLDGDLVGHLPATLTIRQRALRVLVP